MIQHLHSTLIIQPMCLLCSVSNLVPTLFSNEVLLFYANRVGQNYDPRGMKIGFLEMATTFFIVRELGQSHEWSAGCGKAQYKTGRGRDGSFPSLSNNQINNRTNQKVWRHQQRRHWYLTVLSYYSPNLISYGSFAYFSETGILSQSHIKY
jgi:hypothetical protein